MSMWKKKRALAPCIGLGLLQAASLANAADKPPAPTLRIIVEQRDIDGSPFDWRAPTSDIEQVLRLGSEQLLSYFPGRELGDIRIRHQEEFPQTLFQRGRHGEHQVLLTARETYWAQYTYQFAHELGHILTQPDRPNGKNQWFAEALCETSSLFVLSRMSEAWDASPPIPALPRWGDRFEQYADDLLAAPSRRLPPDTTMARWLEANLPLLVEERELTERSKLVAAYLLPIFQGSPGGWESLSFWPGGEDDVELDFEDYLEAWRTRVPERHRAFIREIQGLFGFPVRRARA